MIAGEGLAGVAIAFVVAARTGSPGLHELLRRWHFADRGFAHLTGAVAAIAGVLVVAGVCLFLYRAGLASTAASEAPAPRA